MVENSQLEKKLDFELEEAKDSEKDIQDLISIDETAHDKLRESENGKIYSSSVTKDAWLREFQNSNNKIYFIIIDRKRVGSLMFEEKGNEFYVGGVVMLPDYQNKGVTKRALQVQIDEAKSSCKFQRIWLLVHPVNPAKKLYESMGFYDTGNRVENYDDSGEPRIVMDLNLFQ